MSSDSDAADALDVSYNINMFCISMVCPHPQNMGIRYFDFDVYYDPTGCRYAYRSVRALLYLSPDQTNDVSCRDAGYKVLAIPVCLG